MNTPPLPHDPVLVEVTRGGIVESFHRGAVAVVDADGAVHTAFGDIERPVFPRSAVKVLQALPLVESGAAERYGLSDEELALACASHGGEAPHVAAAASMLAKAGLDDAALECGAHWPYHEGAQRSLAAAGREPGPLHNNCSGKHAGFVCLGCMMAAQTGRAGDVRAFLRGYVQPDHPVMQEVGAAQQAATGWDLDRTARGTDGCSIPTYAIPLRHLAHAFARVATGVGLSPEHGRAARRLREAVARAPHMVAGSGRFDSRVMARLGERVFCKVGAEGVYCAALPEVGLGVALKMDDGNTARAAEVVMAAVIEARLTLAGEDAALMRSLSRVEMRNWNGIEVGSLQAAEALRGR
jgi:L-asparaginase II